MSDLNEILQNIIALADRKYGDPTSAHESLGVIIEEVAELTEAVRSNSMFSVQNESLDIAAAAIRLARICESAQESFVKRSGFNRGS